MKKERENGKRVKKKKKGKGRENRLMWLKWLIVIRAFLFRVSHFLGY